MTSGADGPIPFEFDVTLRVVCLLVLDLLSGLLLHVVLVASSDVGEDQRMVVETLCWGDVEYRLSSNIHHKLLRLKY